MSRIIEAHELREGDVYTMRRGYVPGSMAGYRVVYRWWFTPKTITLSVVRVDKDGNYSGPPGPRMREMTIKHPHDYKLVLVSREGEPA